MMEQSEALRIVRCLADGADPATGEVFAKDSPYQDPQVVRALFVAIAALERSEALHKRKRRLPGNAGAPWTPGEDERLRKEFEDRGDVLEIAERHGRTRGAIAARLVRLGKAESRDAVLMREQAGKVRRKAATGSPPTPGGPRTASPWSWREVGGWTPSGY